MIPLTDILENDHTARPGKQSVDVAGHGDKDGDGNVAFPTERQLVAIGGNAS